MAVACCGRLMRSVWAGGCGRAVTPGTRKRLHSGASLHQLEDGKGLSCSMLWPPLRCMSSQRSPLQLSRVPKTSLSEPPWPEIQLPDPIEETKEHRELVNKVNNLIATGQFGRLFAVVHFASKQWKVTNEDLVLISGIVDAECGDRIRLEKLRALVDTLITGAEPGAVQEIARGVPAVRPPAIRHLSDILQVLLVGSDNFTLLGKPLLGKDLVRVEATVIEKTESYPKINMKFWRRHRYQKKKITIAPQTILRINTIEIAPALS